MSAAGTVKSVSLKDGSTELVSDRGSARMRRLASGIALITCRGVFSEAFHPPMEDFVERSVEAAGPIIVFVDGWELHSVETGFRERWTEWFRKNRQRVRVHMLVRSKLLEMAISLVNLFAEAPAIQIYSAADDWERGCAAHHPGFKRSPSR